jgi:DNA-binding NarL/FixJ family response regulator
MMPTRRSHLAKAHDTIFAQPVPKRVQVSAWQLYLHELENKIKPPRALVNTLRWMDQQNRRVASLKCSPTTHQRRILQLMVTYGWTQKQIAHHMGLSEDTLKKNLANARRRMGVETLIQAIALSVDKGWVKASTSDKSHDLKV